MDKLAEGPGAARMKKFLEFLHGMSGEEPPMGEDCLVLNVWTSSTSRDRKRTVLVYLHGGAYTSGSGSWKLYDGVGLAQRGDAVRSEEHPSELQSLMSNSYAVLLL